MNAARSMVDAFATLDLTRNMKRGRRGTLSKSEESDRIGLHFGAFSYLLRFSSLTVTPHFSLSEKSSSSGLVEEKETCINGISSSSSDGHL